jgi:hypothetical protein
MNIVCQNFMKVNFCLTIHREIAVESVSGSIANYVAILHSAPFNKIENIYFQQYSCILRPPLWSRSQSSWLQVQRSWVRFTTLPDFLRSGSGTGSAHLMSTVEKVLGRNSSGFGLESLKYSHRDLLRWPCDTLYPQKLTLSSPTSSGHSIGIVHQQTKATEFSFSSFMYFGHYSFLC